MSYCFAIIRPNMELATKYEKKMQQETQSQRLLSDQDLLGEVLHDESGFYLMHHDFICFPSWWAHDHLWQARAKEIFSHAENKWELSRGAAAFGDKFLSKFGAVHMSRAFEFRGDVTTLQQKKESWRQGMQKGQYAHVDHAKLSKGGVVTIDDYLEFLGGFWMALRKEHMRQIKEMQHIVTLAIGGQAVPEGLAKIQQTLSFMSSFIVVDLKDAETSSSAAAASASDVSAPWKENRW